MSPVQFELTPWPTQEAQESRSDVVAINHHLTPVGVAELAARGFGTILQTTGFFFRRGVCVSWDLLGLREESPSGSRERHVIGHPEDDQSDKTRTGNIAL